MWSIEAYKTRDTYMHVLYIEHILKLKDYIENYLQNIIHIIYLMVQDLQELHITDT